MEQEEGANKTPSSGTRKPYDPFAFLHQPWKAPCYHESVVWGFVPSMSYISYKWFVYGRQNLPKYYPRMFFMFAFVGMGHLYYCRDRWIRNQRAIRTFMAMQSQGMINLNNRVEPTKEDSEANNEHSVKK
eukprot:TRINITY_DN1748_c0_g1_i2.p1 TRINITY_DN1748_c0_g1~~TRINITY_DN1748_c0_g1_i2.p1  ORF type:complete len:142 (-),score=6.88 TRINITY_DN1748_c0_g1_i2:24-413(-)